MPAPTLTSVNPPIGPTVGGLTVTLTGTNFTGTTGVTIGGVAATNVAVVSATSITCTIPAGSAGGASVLVTNGSGTNSANSLFFYVAAVPTDTHIYLKGGRGDGFVPNWTGLLSEEGMVDGSGVAVDSNGKEVADPYRDIFRTTVGYKVNSFGEGEGALSGVGSVQTTYDGTTIPAVASSTITLASPSDEVAHVKPRQYFKVFTWLVFTSSNGVVYKYRKDLVLGWGSRART